MSDKKISELTASTTPLAGTEVLPIVQSGVTKKTSVESVLTSVQPSGTANGVLYLNGSKVATSGSALAFDGTKFGVGTSSPDAILKVTHTIDSPVAIFENARSASNGTDSAVVKIISQNRFSNLYITASPSRSSNIYLGDSDDNDIGAIVYDNSDDALKITTNAAERLRITSDGYLRMASGTGGIQFNGDTAEANALDDYEEGTFTPVVQGSSSAGTATYSTQNGRYTKIGNKVFFEVYVNYNSGTGTGNLRVGGLPFTSVAAGLYGSVSIGEFNNIALTASNVPAAEVSSGGTQVEFYQNVVGGGATTAIPYDAAGYMIFGGFYTTAS